jgi:3-dehydroquinate synthase
LSQRLGLVDAFFVNRLVHLIQKADLPVKAPRLSDADNAGRYLELMRLDKKSEAGEIKFVVIEQPGRASVRAAPDDVVRKVIDACSAA